MTPTTEGVTAILTAIQLAGLFYVIIELIRVMIGR